VKKPAKFWVGNPNIPRQKLLLSMLGLGTNNAWQLSIRYTETTGKLPGSAAPFPDHISLCRCGPPEILWQAQYLPNPPHPLHHPATENSVPMTLTIPLPRIQIAPGSHLTIADVSWTDFTALLEGLGEKRHTRLAYYQGLLEIMSPLALHEKPNRILAYIVVTLLELRDQDWEDYGSTTLKRPPLAGIEPDTCFYIQNAALMRPARNLNLSELPPPDLAIECDLTSKTVIQAYESIQVPEVWIYANEHLSIYLYSEQGYQDSQRSQIFPELPLKIMIPQLITKAYRIGTRQMLRELKAQL
jgi:Uma2 family endonuclease